MKVRPVHDSASVRMRVCTMRDDAYSVKATVWSVEMMSIE